MGWLWALLAVLVALVVGVQVAYLRSISDLKGAGAARAIRIANVLLVVAAVVLAGYAVAVSLSRGGR